MSEKASQADLRANALQGEAEGGEHFDCFKFGRDGQSTLQSENCRSRDSRDKEGEPGKIREELILYDHSVSSCINFSKYNVIQVIVNGTYMPDKIGSFEDANLDPFPIHAMQLIIKCRY